MTWQTETPLTIRTRPDELDVILALAERQKISRHRAARAVLLAGLQQLTITGEQLDRKKKTPA